MSTFTTPLIIEFDGETNEERPFVLVYPFVYYLGEKDSNTYISVPAGFRTDFASIPRPFRNLFAPTGTYGKAAIVHDYLYSGGAITTHIGGYEHLQKSLTRAKADQIFLEAMTVLKVNRFTRYAIYYAVRLGAGAAWRAYHATEN